LQVIKGPIKFIRGGRYPFCHSVLIDDRVRGVIDASSSETELQDFLSRGKVDSLITSHGHEDHLIFNGLFEQSRFCLHPLDEPQFADVDNLISSFGVTDDAQREAWRVFLQTECRYIPRRPDLFLRDGMVLEFGDVRIEVIHTPGHTRGHCAFHFIQEKILFTADLDLVKAGPFYGDPTSDIEDTIHSLERLKTYRVETYLTSHGKGIYDGDPAQIDRYLGMIEVREERLIESLRRGSKTLEQIVQEGIIYGKKSVSAGPWDLSHSERMMMIKHLARLMERSSVQRDGEVYVLAA
jgi:hydroxyacylglutathione hydrolase